MRKAVVKQTEVEIPVEVIANDIRAISEGVRRLRSGSLNDHALLLLIQHAAPTFRGKYIGIKDIRTVLNAMESLEETYLKKKKP